MFKCCECGCVFEDAKRYTETHGLDSPPYEEYNACPKCAGAFEEAEECAECGEWFRPSEDFESPYCHECARKAYTDDLGLEFVKTRRTMNKYEYSDDFATRVLVESHEYDFRREFIERVHDIDISGDGDIDQLLDVIMGDFETLMALEEYVGTHTKSNQLKDFALEDMEYWVGFLKERNGK